MANSALSKRDQAVAAANTLIGLAQQLKQIRLAFSDFNTQYNSEGYSVTWSNMQTAPFNLDGSLSGTPDGSPVATNPINNSGLVKYVSKNQLTAGVTMLQQLQNFFQNLVVTQGNYSQTVDDLAS